MATFADSPKNERRPSNNGMAANPNGAAGKKEGFGARKGPVETSRNLTSAELARIGRLWGVVRKTAKRVESARNELDEAEIACHIQLAHERLTSADFGSMALLAQCADKKGYAGILRDIVMAVSCIGDKTLWQEMRVEETVLMALPGLRNRLVEPELMGLVLEFPYVGNRTAAYLEKRLDEMGRIGKAIKQEAGARRRDRCYELDALAKIGANVSDAQTILLQASRPNPN